MADKHDADFGPLEQMGYETEDLQVEKSWLAAIYFYAGILVMVGIAWLVVYWLNPDAIVNANRAERRAVPPAEAPLLQSNFTAHNDMVEMMQEDKAKLEGEDEGAISVEEAMDETLSQGLPTRADADLPESYNPGGFNTDASALDEDHSGDDHDGEDHKDEDHEEGEH